MTERVQFFGGPHDGALVEFERPLGEFAWLATPGPLPAQVEAFDKKRSPTESYACYRRGGYVVRRGEPERRYEYEPCPQP